MLQLISAFSVFLYTFLSFAELPLNKIPPIIRLEGDRGKLVETRGPWTSEILQNKGLKNSQVSVLFYVAPSEKELNRKASDAITAKKFPRDQYNSYAVVNMAASWWPNAIIASKIKKSQKEFPHTIYVEDRKAVLVKEWGLKDNSNDVLIFDREGKVVFSKDGKLSDKEIERMLSVLSQHIYQKPASAPKKAVTTPPKSNVVSKQKP